MHVFEFIVLIVICCGIFEFLKQRQKIQATNQTSTKSKQQSDEMQQQIISLQERVAVLEKIVTDKNYDLNRQIDDL